MENITTTLKNFIKNHYWLLFLITLLITTRLPYLIDNTIPFQFDHGKDSLAVMHMWLLRKPKFVGPWTSIPGSILWSSLVLLTSPFLYYWWRPPNFRGDCYVSTSHCFDYSSLSAFWQVNCHNFYYPRSHLVYYYPKVLGILFPWLWFLC